MSLIVNILISKVTYINAHITNECKYQKSISLEYNLLLRPNAEANKKITYKGDLACFNHYNMLLNSSQLNAYKMAIKLVENKFEKLIECYNRIFWENIVELFFCFKKLIGGETTMIQCLHKHAADYEAKRGMCNMEDNFSICLDLDSKKPSLKYSTNAPLDENYVLCNDTTLSEYDVII